jgi:DNA repair photolyase
MGASFLEGGIPGKETCLALIPELVGFLGHPQRLRLRFDPIANFRLPDGSRYSNLEHFQQVAESAAEFGCDVTVSWVQRYEKVDRRLRKYGLEIIEPGETKRAAEWKFISKIAGKLKITLHSCCVPGQAISRCVDGSLLTQLHPEKIAASPRRAGGQRERCGCTESWDIGWYTPCPGQCIYCYARPVEPAQLKGSRP